MFARIKMLWARVRDSLWFVPALFTVMAVLLAVVMVRMDQRFESAVEDAEVWFLTGGAEGARLVLSTIAGSLITVTGVVFSVTIVGLQLASTQFTPRILRNFLADRSNQIVLGVFISTFTYTMLVLRVVRSRIEDEAAFVPHLSVAVAIVLALVSVGFLIHFIHHAARSIQASVILSRVTDDALRRVAQLFPQEIGEAEGTTAAAVEIPARQPSAIAACHAGYLQAVDASSLFHLGEDRQMLIRMAAPIGEFVVAGQPLAQAWAEGDINDEVRQSIRQAFLLGEERTPDQDVEFCLLEISDIGVKALSPGINDPTTAIHCIDRLTQILLALGKRRPPDPMRTKSGRVHFLAMPSTFEHALGVAFDAIAHFGCENGAIQARLRESVGTLQRLLPGERQAALRAYADKLRG